MKARRRKLGHSQTYFLLLLPFSACESLRRPSSDGGVAERFSFLGRAAGIVRGVGARVRGGASSSFCPLLVDFILLFPWHSSGVLPRSLLKFYMSSLFGPEYRRNKCRMEIVANVHIQ
jgi:hypothetical protein